MTEPVKIDTYVTAVAEAMELSAKVDYPIYLFRLNEGGYVRDCYAGAYSNETLILTLLNGERV